MIKVVLIWLKTVFLDRAIFSDLGSAKAAVMAASVSENTQLVLAPKIRAQTSRALEKTEENLAYPVSVKSLKQAAVPAWFGR